MLRSSIPSLYFKSCRIVSTIFFKSLHPPRSPRSTTTHPVFDSTRLSLKRIPKYLMEKMSWSDAQPINLHVLKTITKDFSDNMKIGSGGYGTVYKGVLNGDEIAVKKLFPVPGLDDMAFENEFRNLKKVHHKNVIRMIGYCYDIAHRDVEYQGKLVWSQVIDRALCTEYMKGGSLATHISDESCKYDWPTTYKIIKGTCEGLHYLHKGRGERNFIYHLDLKPDNILLDENLVPKIGDFGLSRLFGESKTHDTSRRKGTMAFMPPEYINNAKVTEKNDVFSLGVIIFYMLAGKRGYDEYSHALLLSKITSKTRQEFIESVQKHWKKKMQAAVNYRWDETDVLGVTKCVEIAMSSVHGDRDSRPSTTEIINELNKLDYQIQEILKKDPKPPIGMVPFEKLDLFNQGEASSSSRTKNYLSATEAMAMSFTELHRMTNGFSEKRLLGIGGYGRVYKGVLDNGEVIAVKRLNNNPELVEDSFKNELLNLMRIQHQNIIRLVGYCSETRERVVTHKGKLVVAGEQERALCLEYMQGGNLDEHLSDESCGLDWDERYKIIKGMCQGLKHLHTGSTEPIYHLDLKPANILLDKDRIPKIGDFGLSRFLDTAQTFVTKTFSGTRGYMPPEYTHGRKISSKFDVFSLGVIMIEIVAGPEGYYNCKCLMAPQEFIDHVTGNWSKRVQYKTMTTEALLEIEKCIKIALRCVVDNHVKRPTITEIVEELMPETIGADVEDSKSIELPSTSLTNQALFSPEDTVEAVANSSVDFNNYLLVQRGNKRRRQEDQS